MSEKTEARVLEAIAKARSGSETLDLSGMGLKALPPISGLGHLRHLYLGGNRLQDLPAELGDLERLEHLDLSENRLSTLPPELAKCAGLTHLDLFGNALADLPSAVLLLGNLVTLDLAKNRLQRLPDLRNSFARLEELDLSGNRLTKLPGGLGGLPRLRILNLSANQLVSVEELLGSKTLEELYLDDNALTVFSNRLAELPSLRLLSAHGNPFGALPRAFAHLRPGGKPRRIGPPLRDLVISGTAPGKRYLAKPPSVFGFSVSLRDATAVAQSLDYYYKEFEGTPVSMRFPDGPTVSLTEFGRKSALELVDKQLGAAAKGTVLEFQPTSDDKDIRRICELAERTTARVPGADLIEPKFYFMLRGEDTRGNAIHAYGRATLEFRYAPPPPGVLAVIEKKPLEEARKADVDITLQLSVRGELEILGERRATASFRGGTMVQPLAFVIEAGAATGTMSWIHVDFLVKGELVCQTEQAIMVVATEEELARSDLHAGAQTAPPPSMPADALIAAPPPPDRIELRLFFDHGNFRIDLHHLKDGREIKALQCPSTGIDRGRLETLIKGVRGDLAPCYKYEDFWLSFDGKPPLSDVGRLALECTLDAVAVAGCRLNRSLRESVKLAEALDYVENEAPEGAVLTIFTDDVFLPWEFLYPKFRAPNMTDQQKERNPIKREAFWGARFAIETVQGQVNVPANKWHALLLEIAALQRTQIETQPRVSINLNPTIVTSAEGPVPQPIPVQVEWAARLKKDGVLDTIQQSCKTVRSILQDCAGDPTLIYVYCHGSSPNPFGGGEEMLDLDNSCKLKPMDLGDNSTYPAAPIVFLNSCESGAYSPLTFSNFLTEFRRRGALGMIATSYSIPIVFGAHFGEEVVDCYLKRSGSLAVAMHKLRRDHLLDCYNPVPLFYSLQCQLSFPPANTPGGSK